MRRKIKRILIRVGSALFLLLILLAGFLYFVTQSPGFQTWLGKKASAYLSGELGTTISVDHIRLKLFREAELRGVLVLDQKGDTLFAGDAQARIRTFDYRNRRLIVEEAGLSNSTMKIVRYRGDSVFNYMFLADYFSGSDTGSASPWDVQVRNIALRNVSFVYRIEERAGGPADLIDYDNVVLSDLSGKINDIRIDSGVVQAEVKDLAAREKSGFVLRELSTRATISDQELHCGNLVIATNNSRVTGELTFHHKNWEAYDDFIQLVSMEVRFDEGTGVSGDDIAFFAKELKGLHTRVALKGDVRGTVSDLHLKKFRLAFGKESLFLGDLSLSGLPETEASFIHMNAKALSTSYYDLAEIPSWPFSKEEKLELPEELKTLGLISYRGKLDGFLNDFTTYGTFQTRLGKAETQLSVRTGDGNEPVQYKGRLKTVAFNAGPLLGVRELGTIDMDVDVKGKGLNIQSLDAELAGEISGIHFNGYRYSGISVNGTFSNKLFNGLVISHDPNADFDFNGSINFQNKVPEMDFMSTINRLSLNELNFAGKRDSGYFSGQVLIDINGDNIDNLTGNINVDEANYRTPARSYRLNSLRLQLDQGASEKKINLRSEYLNAYMSGRFNLSDLPGAFKTVLYHYYPTFFRKPVLERRYRDRFSLSVTVLNLNNVIDLFIPDLRIVSGTKLEGDFDAQEKKLNMQLSSRSISYKTLRAEELHVLLNERGNTVIAEASGRTLRYGDSLGFRNFNLSTRSFDKESAYSFDWDNLRQPVNRGSIAGNLRFGTDTFTISNEKISLTVNDSVWLLSRPHLVYLEKNGNVEVQPMEIRNNNQAITVEGRMTDSPQDSLIVGLRNLSLSQFNPLLELWKLNLRGTSDGHIALSRLNGNLTFNGDVQMNDLTLNGNTIGALNVRAIYNAGEKQIGMQGYTSLGLKDEQGRQVKNISFRGTYYLDRKEESLDFDFEARPANLKLLNPYLEDIITIRNAYVNGEGKVHGTPDNVKIDGQFKLFNSEITVDYTNVTYHVTGLIEVMPDQIRFSELLMREKGSRSAPQGTINGNIFHRNFGNMQIDYDVSYRNMLVLNTGEKDNSTFYGRIFGSGRMGIYGFINNLHMEIVDTTKKNSLFVLPLDGPAEIGESDFIHFVKKDTVKTRKQKTLTGFDLVMNIHATPDAEAQIILDKQHGDMLSARGEGDLTLRINTLGKFEMFGDYVITDGSYLFTLENVINKRFEIDPGSSISWSGDPYTAEVDVVTRYRQRTSIAALLNDTTGQYKSRVPVDCKLLISGRLRSPEIRFAIDLPNTDANAKARIASVLSDEAELNRQVFSFLLFRSFVTPQIYRTHGGGVSAGGAAASTGSEMLSNRVSEFLNTYVGNLTGISDLQLGLNYRPGSQNSTDAVDLALSKQFLNNKITVDGNFGVNNNNTQSRNSGGLIGDVNIDYKLSEDGRYRLKGFNRSNDNTQITTAGGPYTQGIGIFYREEFETFQQLLRRYLKKKRPLPVSGQAKVQR